jgi:hypothetical protein
VSATDGRPPSAVAGRLPRGRGRVFVVSGVWGEVMGLPSPRTIREFAPAIVAWSWTRDAGPDETPPAPRPRRRITCAARAGTLAVARRRTCRREVRSPRGADDLSPRDPPPGRHPHLPGQVPRSLGKVPPTKQARGLAELQVAICAIRGLGRHKRVHAYPYGGAPVLGHAPEPIGEAPMRWRPLHRPVALILLDPGAALDQGLARSSPMEPRLTSCVRGRRGRRPHAGVVDLELCSVTASSGGEPRRRTRPQAAAARCAIDGASPGGARLHGLAEYPPCTRPPECRGLGILEVLSTGHRGRNSEVAARPGPLERTRAARPARSAARHEQRRWRPRRGRALPGTDRRSRATRARRGLAPG